MKNTTEMYPGCLYLFEGESSSSSCFIQNEEDAKSFMYLANTYLKDFLKIHEYNLTKDSWMMIVSIRSREKILKSYYKRREQSKTCDRKHDHSKIWKIISEQMRQFLKLYVTEANRRSGRQGSLVKAPYKRSFFESLEEAHEHVKGLRNQILKREQKLNKYRGRKKFYKIKRKKEVGHIFLCTKWKNTQEGINHFFRKIRVEMQAIINFEEFMSSKIVNRTLFFHPSPKPS